MEQMIYNPWPYKENKYYSNEDIRKGFYYLCNPKNREIFKKYCEVKYEKATTNDRNFNIFLDLIGVNLYHVAKFGNLPRVTGEGISIDTEEMVPLSDPRPDIREICWENDVTRTRLHQIFTKYMILLKRTIRDNPDKDVEIMLGEPITKHVEHEGRIIYEHELKNIRDSFEVFVKLYVNSQEFSQAIRESEYVQSLLEFSAPGSTSSLFKTAKQIFDKYIAFKKYVMEVEEKFAALDKKMAEIG